MWHGLTKVTVHQGSRLLSFPLNFTAFLVSTVWVEVVVILDHVPIRVCVRVLPAGSIAEDSRQALRLA